MEFDKLFTAVQGILRGHQNRTVVKFDKLCKDNDVISESIISSLHSLIKELALKNEYKRRINLLLIINTDFPSILTLEDDQNFWHLLGCLPKMSPYLYFQIASNLEFIQDYIGEIIHLCPEYLTVDVLNAISVNLKFLNPDVAIGTFQALFISIFEKIAYLQKNKHEPEIILQKLILLFKDFIYFDWNQLSWNPEEKSIINGYMTRMLFIVLTDVINYLHDVKKEKPIEIYDFIDYDYDYSKWGECRGDINWTYHCLNILIAVTTDMVTNVSVDTYMSWCEVNIRGSVDKTLQTSVREEAYYCREALRSFSHVKDDIPSLTKLEKALDSISVEPVTEDDEIKRSDAEAIVINLLNPNRTQVKWLKGLILIPGIFQSSTYMKVIEDNAHLFNLEVAIVLLDTLLDFLSNSQCPRELCEAAKDVFFSCLKKLPLSLQIELLSYYYETKTNFKILQRENFSEALTSTLNKISTANRSEVMGTLVGLCFENYELVTISLLNESLNHEVISDVLIEMLQYIHTGTSSSRFKRKEYCTIMKAVVSLIDTIVSSPQYKKDNFVKVISKLWDKDIFDGEVFFPLHAMSRFEASVNEGNTHATIFYLDLLNLYVSQKKTLFNNSGVLVLLFARFVDGMRPSISSITLDKLKATATAIDIIKKITQKIVDSREKEDDDVFCLRKLACKLKPMTSMHMAVLWTKWSQAVPSYPSWATPGLGLHDGIETVTESERRALVTSLVKVLPFLTLIEWYLVGGLEILRKNLLVPTLEAVIDSILVSFHLPFLLKNIHILNNILVNFSQFFWEKAIPLLKFNTEVEQKKIVDKLTYLQEVMPAELRKTIDPQINLIIQAINKFTNREDNVLS